MLLCYNAYKHYRQKRNIFHPCHRGYYFFKSDNSISRAQSKCHLGRGNNRNVVGRGRLGARHY